VSTDNECGGVTIAAQLPAIHSNMVRSTTALALHHYNSCFAAQVAKVRNSLLINNKDDQLVEIDKKIALKKSISL